MFWLSWPNKWYGAIDDTIGVRRWHWCQWFHMIKSLVPHFDCLGLRNAMMSLMMQPESCDLDANKYHVTSHFNCQDLMSAMLPLKMPSASHAANISTKYITSHQILIILDQRNAVVVLMMPLVSNDADSGASGITWPKSCCISFWSSWHNTMWHCYQHQWHHMTKKLQSMFQSSCPNLCSCFADNTTDMAWYWCKCQQGQMTEKACYISFQLSWTNKCNDVIDDAISVMWCWHWYNGQKSHWASFQLS